MPPHSHSEKGLDVRAERVERAPALALALALALSLTLGLAV